MVFNMYLQKKKYMFFFFFFWYTKKYMFCDLYELSLSCGNFDSQMLWWMFGHVD